MSVHICSACVGHGSPKLRSLLRQPRAVFLEQIPNFRQQLFRRRWSCWRRRRRGNKLRHVPHNEKDHERDQYEIDRQVDEVAVVDGGNARRFSRSHGVVSLSVKSPVQLFKVRALRQLADRWHHDVIHQRIDDRSKRATDDYANRQVHDVPTQYKRLKITSKTHQSSSFFRPVPLLVSVTGIRKRRYQKPPHGANACTGRSTGSAPVAGPQYPTPMKNIRFVTLLCLLFATPAFTATSAETSIKAVLTAQVDAWNKGDLSTFVTSYAEDCLFVGKQVVRGRSAVLARYQKSYSSAAAMGKLEFADLEVHEVDPQVALVIGHFHLTRTPEGGGDAQGVFSLVFHRIGGKWQIVLDHTS